MFEVKPRVFMNHPAHGPPRPGLEGRAQIEAARALWRVFLFFDLAMVEMAT